MGQNGTKRSRQRDKVLAILKSTRSHPTAEWIFERVRTDLPRISLGTVYRNLHVLRTLGKIQELDFGEGLRRYDGTPDEHYHFVCEQCGVVKDLDLPPQHALNDLLQGHGNLRVRTHRLDFFGTCEECRVREN